MVCVDRLRISWSCWTGQGSGEPNKDDTRQRLRRSQPTTCGWCVCARRYLDAKTRTLYLWPNTTSVPKLRAATLDTVVLINGSAAQPVENVSFEGVGFG